MARCEKADGRGGRGCVREGGHRGRHKVRGDAEAMYAAGGEAAPPARRAGRSSAEAGGLDALAAKIDAEAKALAEDVEALVEAAGRRIDGVKARQVALLKSLVRSRRQVARLRDRLDEREAEGDTEHEADDAE